MRLIQSIKLALKNIKSNRLRSILTMIGIIIGISSVIIIVGIGNGSSQDILSKVETLGPNLITVNVMNKSGLAQEDLDTIKNIDGVKEVSSTISASGTLKYDKQSNNYSITGASENLKSIRALEVSSGRFISNIDVENRNKVIVIGANVVTELFGFVNPINKIVNINGDEYTVVGVLKTQGGSTAGNVDDMVVAPFSTTTYLAKSNIVSNAFVVINDKNQADTISTVIQNYLNNKFKGNTGRSFSVITQAQLIETVSSISTTLTMLLGGIAAISLVVGGIGVMNVMLVSVTERTREIGVRKALGGKRKDIMIQFMIEALVLCSIGGIIGVLLGIGGGQLIKSFGINVVFSSDIIIISFLLSMLIGVVFGIFPAYKASKLKPIDALRYE